MPRGKAKRSGGITKWDAVEQALAGLGNDAMPVAIQDYVKSTFGLDMNTGLISNYKSNILKKGGARKAGAGKKNGRVAATTATTGSAAGAGISVEDIRAVKELVDRMGADRLRELAQVLAK